MPKWTGYAANGGSDFAEKKHLPRLSDNHATKISTEGVAEGFKTVIAALDAQVISGATGQGQSWVDQFKGSRHFISPVK